MQTGSPVNEHEDMPDESSFHYNATTTRVRPRAFVHGVSAIFEPPSLRPPTMNGRQPPRNLNLSRGIASSNSDTFTPGTVPFNSTLKSRFNTGWPNPRTASTYPTHPEENTMELLKQLNVNLEQTNRAILEMKESFVEQSRKAAYLGDQNHQELMRKNEKVAVSVRVQFLSIYDVNCSRGEFSAEILLQAKWHDPSLDELSEDETEFVDWDTLWMPQIIIKNECHSTGDYFHNHHHNNNTSTANNHPLCQSESRDSQTVRAITTGKNGLNMVSMRQKIKSTFYFEPKMGLYPFDCQSLPIEVSSSREIDEIELDEDEYECCSINISSSTSRNHNHQSSDFSIQTLVSTSREISLDCLDESSHHVFTCTAYACRTWISHMLFTLLPIFLLAFAVVLIGGILPHSQSSSAPQEISDDSSSSSSSSSPVSSYNHEISSELTRVANPIILLIVSCFFVLLSIKTGSFEATRNTGSNTLLGVYIVSHCIFVLLLAIKYISEMGGVSTNGRQQQQLLFFPPLEVQLGGGRVLGLGQIAALILFLAINFVFYISVVILLIWRCIGMKRKARRLMKRQTDYRRLRSAREHSVQSFSNISRNKLHSKNRHRTTAAQVRPRPFSAAVVTSEHAGAMPRSKWRLEQSNNPSENNSSSGDLFDHAPSPDSHMPRSISFPTSVIHGFKEIPV